MKPKKYKVMIDIYKGVLNNQVIEFTTQDNGSNVLEFEILEDKVTPYNLDGCIVRMVINGQQQDCTIVDGANGQVKIVLLQSMFSQVGLVTAELQIYDATNQTLRLTTPRFRYNVKKSLMDDETVQADPNYSILQNMILEVTGANEIADKAKTTAEAALTKSNQAVTTINNEVAKVNKAVTDAQTALDRAESVVTQEELAKKVTLDGNDTKFDFIKNQVVKDGLIEYVNKKITGAHVVNKLDISNDFTLVGCIRNYNKTTLWYVPNVGQMRLVVDAQSNKLTINGFEDRRILETDATPIIEFAMIKQGSRFTISINGIIAVTDLKYADEDIINKWNTNKFSFGYNSATLEVEYTCNNRALAQQEIQHIFSVINNTPSIKELHTTNAEGETSILKLASNEDHVEMASGRTLREEYMGVLKTMGKEFTSADGSPIEVNKGIKARLISGEIKGQTVKCISKLLKYTHDASTGRTKDVNLQLEKAKYTFSVEVTENVGNNILGFIFKDGASDVYKNIPINGVGFFKNVIDLSTCINNPRLYAIYATESGVSGSNKLVEQVNILYGEVNLITGLVDKGLSSTEAIISNNGQQYPIYHPTELNEDGSKKVISLGGLGDTKDTLEILEDGSGIWIQDTKELIFDGSESWAEETSGIYRLSSTESVFGKILNSEGKVRVKSNLYNGDTWSNGWVKDSIIFLHTGGALFVRDTKIATVQDFKSKLSKTNLIVRGSLGTPIITHIPKELVPAILTYKTNILDVGGAVKPSSFKVTLPVDKLAEIEARLQALESTTVDVVLNK